MQLLYIKYLAVVNHGVYIRYHVSKWILFTLEELCLFNWVLVYADRSMLCSYF